MRAAGLFLIARYCLLILILLLSPLSWPQSAEADAQDSPAVRRPNPVSEELLPVAPDEIVVGKIYNHFSQRHGRYVWAYAIEGGGFSYALGPGSTELPANFDVAASQSETQGIIESVAGPWAEKSRLEGKQILVRLGADGRWSVLRGRGIRSHYDLDTGRRWEWHGRRKVAVLHTGGVYWSYIDNRYMPSWNLLVAEGAIQGDCNCVQSIHPILQ